MRSVLGEPVKIQQFEAEGIAINPSVLHEVVRSWQFLVAILISLTSCMCLFWTMSISFLRYY